MSNTIVLCGLSITKFPQSKNPQAEIAELVTLYPLENLTLEKIERKAVGLTTETPFGKQKLSINPAYAHDLIDTRAFVANREYEVTMGLNTESMVAEITKITPTDPALKKHFDECMKTVA